MSTMKNHLADFHKKASEHHANMSDHFQTLAKCVEKSAAAKDSGQPTLEAMAAEHAAMSEYHGTARDKCQKAAADELAKGDRLMPTEISAVAPERPNIRPVPRHGQPEAAASAVPYQFAKLVTVDEDDDRWTA